MSNCQNGKPAPVLDPIERVSEVIFGLLMAMMFVGALSFATAGREEIRTMMITALGCNLVESKGAHMSRELRAILASVLASALLAGCVVYQPVPAPGPSNFDRAWNAALGGAHDAGVQITSAEPTTGLIRGTKDGIDVTVVVARQGDDSVRVQFDAKGPTQRDPGPSNRFSQAYDRRMGR